ncbi:OmpH family outer membrane protein [Winogradskyella flava]|uniref:OmpH family outer membrane protein n=1 Tax=Winogradskyella flava TaxID=1884876 RepID=UPI0024908C6D|nr:OmpH family outer membrane protein [Winogradskyella flava]
MKRIITAVIILMSFASCQEQDKVAFVDNTKVMDDYQMKIDIEKKYEDRSAAFNKQRDSIGLVYQMEIQTIQMQLNKMSPRKQEEESQKFQQKWQPVQQQMQFQQQQMEQGFNKEMDSVIVKVNDFVEDYGKKNGYTFIFGKNRAGSVMYGAEAKDITEAVTEAINADYGKKDNEDKAEESEKGASEEKETSKE